MAILLGKVILSFPTIVKNPRLTFEQMLVIGVRSLPLVFITSIFTGAVSAWQAAYQQFWEAYGDRL